MFRHQAFGQVAAVVVELSEGDTIRTLQLKLKGTAGTVVVVTEVHPPLTELVRTDREALLMTTTEWLVKTGGALLSSLYLVDA
jgi:hypothetical protein